MKGPITTAGLMALLLSQGMPLLASESDPLLDTYVGEELLMLATGTPLPISKAPSVATVITADDIKATGATDIAQILESVPGLHVATFHQLGEPAYTFRGVYSDINPQVLVMVNGIPLNVLFEGRAHQIMAGFPIESISRIEVIRGPGSAVYGADAFAGVINIITKRANEVNGTEVGGRTGSFDTQDAWLSHGGQWLGLESAFFLEYHTSDGHRETVDYDAQSFYDGLYGTSASHAPGPVNLARKGLDMRLDLSRDKWQGRLGMQQRHNLGTYTGVAYALDPASRYASERYNGDLSWHDPHFTDTWDLKAEISAYHTSAHLDGDSIATLYPAGTTLFGDVTGDGTPDPLPDGLIGNPENWERHYRAEVTGLYSGLDNHQLRLGLGWHHGAIYKVHDTRNFGPNPATGIPTLPLAPNSPIFDVSNTPYVFLHPNKRINLHGYVQDVWQFANDWHLTAGIRHDDYSDFGSTTNPRLALVWWSDYNLTTKLLYGRAFRSPSFVEMYAINNPVNLGNPNLKPETMESIELAFDYHPNERVITNLNFFRYDWQNKIEYVPDPGFTSNTAQNTARQTGYGMEFETTWTLNSQWQMQGNYAWQTSEDRLHDTPAGHAPNHQIYLRADWKAQHDWHINSQINWVGERKRPVGDTREALSGYTTVDLTLRHAPIQQPWELAASVRNLFDADVREPSTVPHFLPDDLPSAGRSVFAEARYKF